MPFSWIYGKITDLRNTLFDSRVLKSHALGAPTISVGNITVGGTGKTPMVAFVAEVLAEKGEKICVLTRGYGRQKPRERVLVSDGEKILANAKESGDEPFELAKKLLGKAIIIADADRAAAAKWARENFEVSVFLLDDGFQHRQARRDLDIVLLDATNPFGNAKTLPFGRLREPLENLSRADAIVITRANLVGKELIGNYKSQIKNYNPDCPVFTAENKISKLVELNAFLAGQQIPTDNGQRTTDKTMAFCALGNPDNFFDQLRRENFNLTATHKFPDHHRYTAQDIAKLEAKAKQHGAKTLLTTAKDAVKLADLKFDLPCFVVESQMIFDDEEKLREIIAAILN